MLSNSKKFYADLVAQELTWSDVRDKIMITDYELFQVIEDLSPSNELTFVKVRYPYGTKIVNNGIFNLPSSSGDLFPINSFEIPSSLQNKLSYSPIPLGVLLNKSCEVFIERENQSVPLILLPSGSLFGLFEITSILSGMMPEPEWNVASGARFLFMLPDIHDQASYRSFKKELGINIRAPQSFAEHGNIFAQLCSHLMGEDNWHSEILFFSNKWFERLQSDPVWSRFYNYLFKYSAQQVSRSYKDSTFEIIWSFAKKAIHHSGVNITPYLLKTVKHLIAVATGVMPGFRSAEDNDNVAPVRLIKKLFTEFYPLGNSLPTLMHSHHQTKGEILRPSYYSLSFPTLFDEIDNTVRNIPNDLQMINNVLNVLYHKSTISKMRLPKSYSLLENVQYKLCYHGKNNASSMYAMMAIDKSLANDKHAFPDRELCVDSSFFNGCIQIYSCLTPEHKYPFGFRIISGR